MSHILHFRHHLREGIQIADAEKLYRVGKTITINVMKSKISLSEFKVKSFVTSVEPSEKKTVNGGGFLSIGRECTQLNNCPLRDDHTKGLFCKEHI